MYFPPCYHFSADTLDIIRRTAWIYGANSVRIDYWQQRTSWFSLTRSEASLLSRSCSTVLEWCLMPYLTERHTGIHIGIWCPGQALCPELWESLKRNYRSHEMSVDPYCIPWHCAEISFTDFKDKFKSCHVCFVKNDDSPSKPIFLCRNDCQ